MSIKLFGISDWIDDLRDRRPVLGEIVKQLIDQYLHVLTTVVSVWSLASLVYWASPYSWVAVAVTLSTTVGVLGTAAWNIYREWKQWPSSRWWDPYLDWTFQTAGTILGAWSWVSYVT